MKITRLLRCFAPYAVILLLAPLAVACTPEPATITETMTPTITITVPPPEYPGRALTPEEVAALYEPESVPEFCTADFTPHPWQQTVNAMMNLSYKRYHTISDAGWIFDFIADGTDYNDYYQFNEIFSVLTNLSVKDGYVIDWVLWEQSQPRRIARIPYVRELTQPPFASYPELLASLGYPLNEEAYDGAFLYDLERNTECLQWQNYIEIDGTPEGFFEFMLLCLRNDSSLFEAYMNEPIVICDCSGLRNVVDDMDFFTTTYVSLSDVSIPQEILDEASQLDFSPVVEMNDDTVSISIVTYNKWTGFSRETMIVSRTWPHTIQKPDEWNETERERILYHECGVHLIF